MRRDRCRSGRTPPPSAHRSACRRSRGPVPVRTQRPAAIPVRRPRLVRVRGGRCGEVSVRTRARRVRVHRLQPARASARARTPARTLARTSRTPACRPAPVSARGRHSGRTFRQRARPAMARRRMPRPRRAARRWASAPEIGTPQRIACVRVRFPLPRDRRQSVRRRGRDCSRRARRLVGGRPSTSPGRPRSGGDVASVRRTRGSSASARAPRWR